MLNKIILTAWIAGLVLGIIAIRLEASYLLKNIPFAVFSAATGLYIFLCREEILGLSEKQKQPPTV